MKVCVYFVVWLFWYQTTMWFVWQYILENIHLKINMEHIFIVCYFLLKIKFFQQRYQDMRILCFYRHNYPMWNILMHLKDYGYSGSCWILWDMISIVKMLNIRHMGLLSKALNKAGICQEIYFKRSDYLECSVRDTNHSSIFGMTTTGIVQSLYSSRHDVSQGCQGCKRQNLPCINDCLS